MAKKYSEILKEMYKNFAIDAATYSCEMEYYMDRSNYNMAEFFKFRVGECLKHARQFKERYLKRKKIEEEP